MIGFVFNACDACIANGKVNDNAHTVRFHVDNLMSSHVDSKVNNKFSMWLNKHCGKCSEAKATRGDTHDCPGMTFGFNDGKVEIDVVKHTVNVLKEFPVKFKETLENVTPAGGDLFGVRVAVVELTRLQQNGDQFTFYMITNDSLGNGKEQD